MYIRGTFINNSFKQLVDGENPHPYIRFTIFFSHVLIDAMNFWQSSWHYSKRCTSTSPCKDYYLKFIYNELVSLDCVYIYTYI